MGVNLMRESDVIETLKMENSIAARATKTKLNLDSVDVVKRMYLFHQEPNKEQRLEDKKKKVISQIERGFRRNAEFHSGVSLNELREAVRKDLFSVFRLEIMMETGGEPEFVWMEDNEFVIADCSLLSPFGRRNLVYDKAAEELMTKHYPSHKVWGNVEEMAERMQVSLFDLERYEKAKFMFQFDVMSASWIHTPLKERAHSHAFMGNFFHCKKKNVCYQDPQLGWRGYIKISR